MSYKWHRKMTGFDCENTTCVGQRMSKLQSQLKTVTGHEQVEQCSFTTHHLQSVLTDFMVQNETL